MAKSRKVKIQVELKCQMKISDIKDRGRCALSFMCNIHSDIGFFCLKLNMYLKFFR